MSSAAEKLKSELAQLPTEDRAALAHFLILSLEGAEDTDVEAAWDAELERRAQEIRSGIAKGKPSDQVFNELRERFS